MATAPRPEGSGANVSKGKPMQMKAIRTAIGKPSKPRTPTAAEELGIRRDQDGHAVAPEGRSMNKIGWLMPDGVPNATARPSGSAAIEPKSWSPLHATGHTLPQTAAEKLGIHRDQDGHAIAPEGRSMNKIGWLMPSQKQPNVNPNLLAAMAQKPKKAPVAKAASTAKPKYTG